MASHPCADCVKAARAKNGVATCTFFNSERGCRYGADCNKRHGPKVCEFYLQGHCTKSGCTFSHNLQKPCTHEAAAAPPSPAVSAPLEVAESSVICEGAAAAKQSTFSPDAEDYIPVEKALEAFFDENAILQDANETLQENIRRLQNRVGALIWILRSTGMTQADIDTKVDELTTMPEEEEP